VRLVDHPEQRRDVPEGIDAVRPTGELIGTQGAPGTARDTVGRKNGHGGGR